MGKFDKLFLKKVYVSEKLYSTSSKIVNSVSKWDSVTKGLALTSLVIGLYGVYSVSSVIANTPRGYNLYDKDLRISFYMPYSWDSVVPKEDEIYKVAKSSSGNAIFDIMVHPLKEEVVPFAFSRGEKKKEEGMYPTFMTMAFRGADEEYSYLKDKMKLGDDFKALLKGMKHSDIKLLSVENKTTGGYNGIILKGKGTYNKEKITYTQYFEPVGANIMVITHGTTDGSSGDKDILTLLKDLKVMPLGAYGVDSGVVDLEDGFDNYKQDSDDGVDAVIEEEKEDVQEKQK